MNDVGVVMRGEPRRFVEMVELSHDLAEKVWGGLANAYRRGDFRE